MIQLAHVTKTYRIHDGTVNALDGVDLDIKQGEFVTLKGPSGSGKTTLLMTASGMQRPTTGKVIIAQTDLYAMSWNKRAAFRAKNIGFVFQLFHLVPYLTVIENIALAGKGDSKKRAGLLAEGLGLKNRLHQKPAQLSAGEKQRTAIARAMLNDPQIILADEPTGNLDLENALIILKCLSEFHQRGGTVILATHDTAADQFSDRVIRMQNGIICG